MPDVLPNQHHFPPLRSDLFGLEINQQPLGNHQHTLVCRADTSEKCVGSSILSQVGEDRFVLGSVAERVMREAPCSVLVVKLPKGAAGTEQPTSDSAVIVTARA